MNITQIIFTVIPPLGWGINNGFFVPQISRRMGSLPGALFIQIAALAFTALLSPWFLSVPPEINWPPLVVAGLLSAGAYALFLRALEVGEVHVVLPISYLWAVVAALLGIVFLGETFTGSKIASSGATLVGAWLLSAGGGAPGGKRASLSRGALYALLGAVAWGTFSFLLAVSTREMGWLSTNIAVRAFTVLFLGCAFLVMFRRGKTTATSGVPWRYLMIAALIDTAAFGAYNVAVGEYPVSLVATSAAAAPLISVTVASVFLNEKITFTRKIGIALVVAGIAGLQLS